MRPRGRDRSISNLPINCIIQCDNHYLLIVRTPYLYQIVSNGSAMGRTEPIRRRQLLRLSGGTMTMLSVAGCLSDEDIRGETDESESNETPDAGTGDESVANESVSEGDEAESGDDDEAGENDNGATDDGTDVSANWENVDEIVLSATTAGWEGIAPAAIEGEKNPTLVLEAGAEYVITWRNDDGQPHNIEIWDESESVLDDYETELMDEKDETQSLEIEARGEMAEYVCEIHADWSKRGDIEIEGDP